MKNILKLLFGVVIYCSFLFTSISSDEDMYPKIGHISAQDVPNGTKVVDWVPINPKTENKITDQYSNGQLQFYIKEANDIEGWVLFMKFVPLNGRQAQVELNRRWMCVLFMSDLILLILSFAIRDTYLKISY